MTLQLYGMPNTFVTLSYYKNPTINMLKWHTTFKCETTIMKFEERSIRIKILHRKYWESWWIL